MSAIATLMPGADERLGHAEPDSAPASGDEGDLAFDVPHGL